MSPFALREVSVLAALPFYEILDYSTFILPVLTGKVEDWFNGNFANKIIMNDDELED